MLGKRKLCLEKIRKIGYTTNILEFWRYYTYGSDYKRYDYRRHPGYWPETAPIFLSIGMHCLGCPSSRGETVEQACMVHGVEVEELLAKINASVAAAQ